MSYPKEKERQDLIRNNELTTFTVPKSIINLKENISICTNNYTELSKNKIINQAFKFHSQGNIVEAEKYYKYCINKDINDPEVFSNYGVILKDYGKLKEAESFLRKSIKIKPDFANAHYNLGIILKDLGKSKEAESFLRKSIKIKPDFANAHYNLGIILKDLGKLKDAVLSFRRTIKINPHLADAYLNLSGIFRAMGESKEAEISTRKVIELNPNYAEAHLNLGTILNDNGKLKEAELSTLRAIELKPDYANAHYNLGIILLDLGKLKEAESAILKAIEISPNFAEAYLTLFSLFEKANDLKSLEKSLKEYNNINIIANECLLFRARLCFRNKEYSEAKNLINNISSKWIEKSSEKVKLSYWSFRGFIEEKVKNYDLAFKCFTKSQQDSAYSSLSKDSYLNEIYSYKSSIKDRNITKHNYTYTNSNICFLIGFPRSGTTLLDTILRSHPDIEVIEEKPLITSIEKLIKEELNTRINDIYNISEDNLRMLREQYLLLLEKYIEKSAKIKIDKLPLHTTSLPLINLLFPEARIIFTHRHPYDTVLSCFQQLFKPNEAMANMTSLKNSSIIYNEVMKAWDIYKNNLNINFITSKYEDLVEDFDGHTLQILDYLDLEWHENLKNYRKTALDRGKINTPSSSQVIQPLYKSSIAKWKKYEKYFEDCHQYLEKWVSYFKYE